MCKIIILLILTLSFLKVESLKNYTKIVGGNILDIKNASFMGMLFHQKKFICGASILNKKYLITAAHCIKNRSAKDFIIKTGSNSKFLPGNVYKVKKTIVHPYYNKKGYLSYDVALVEVESVMSLYNLESAVNLPKGVSDAALPGEKVFVLGYGQTQNANEPSGRLRSAEIEIIDHRVCKDAYKKFITLGSETMCAGTFKGDKDSCQGDSGGPLMKKDENTLIGIVSTGFGCAKVGFPGIYINVMHILPWINANISS